MPSSNCSYEYGSSLRDVVGSNPKVLNLWELHRVDIPGLCTTLHEKFWGKSMLAEEEEWKRLGVTAMDVDDSDGDNDGDITNGCYVLDIDTLPKIWVRADFIRIYEELEISLNTRPRVDMSLSAVVVGQPGIGKSIWVYYALRRRLGEQKPVIWYSNGTSYLFVAEGVYEKPAKFPSHDFVKLVWTLIDVESVPTHLMDQGTKLFIILSTSPNRLRWKELAKSSPLTRCIMNPWTRREMHQLIASIPDLNLEFDQTSTIYDKFGPVPRLWIELKDSKKRADYESAVKAAIDEMTTSQLSELFKNTRSFSMDVLSHKLFLIERAGPSPRDLYTIAPITQNIQSMLANRFRFLERLEVIDLYIKFEKVPEAWKLAGIMFEALGQRILQEKIMLNIVPMVRLDQVPGEGKPQWYSIHIPLGNEDLNTKCSVALKQSKTLTVEPTSVVLSNVTSLLDGVKAGVYYVPEKTNQVAIDSFIVLNGQLYLFQFTIAGQHGVKAGLKRFLETCPGIPAEKNWHFVFIIQTGSTLISPQLPAALGKLPVFSATIDVKRIRDIPRPRRSLWQFFSPF